MASQDGDIFLRVLGAVERQPGNPVAWRALGEVLLGRGQASAAVDAYRQAVSLDPTAAAGWMGVGVALRAARRHVEGCQALARAVELAPHDAAAWGNLSAAREACGDIDGALAAADEAIARAPHTGGWQMARATALRSLGNTEGALQALAVCEASMPGDPRIAWNRALTLLSAARFEEGFAAYEDRRLRPQHVPLPTPEWRTGPPPPEGVVVVCEQGFGDILQWARFLPRLARQTARVVVAAPLALHSLLGRVAGVTAVVDKKQLPSSPEVVGCRAFVGLLSLGARLGASGADLAADLPLWAPTDAEAAPWRTRRGRGGLAVGIGWQGNPAYERDHLRSPPLSAFRTVAEVPGVRLVSLQKVHGLDQLRQATGALSQVDDWGSHLDEDGAAFVETAAAMASLDLVLTSDTATAHLAASLGRPTWLVLSHPADWRWGTHTSRTPWYPSLRMVRQAAPGDWASVFSRVAAGLAEWIQTGAPPEDV